MKLSIVIPVYNEESTISKIIEIVKKQKVEGVEKEVIVVDDGSTDDTKKILEKTKGIILVRYEKNRGKGYAIKTGLKKITGDIVLFQDADLELNPADYPSLIRPILEKKAKVVYGSRRLDRKKDFSFIYFFGGRMVTYITNLLYGSNITDEPCGYKVFKSDIIKDMEINGEGFNWEPEVTAKIFKKGIKIYEVPVEYTPRNKREGKKLNILDGIEAVWTLIKYKFKD